MPRASKEVKELAEKNSDSMKECGSFEYWAKKHQLKTDRIEAYRKAFELVNSGEEDEEENS